VNVSTLICTYIYETFVSIKTALEVAQAAADKILDTIYGLVKLALWSVREILDPVIKVIRNSISSLIKSLGTLWIRDFSNTKMCQNLYKCEFFRDYLLNPDSIFSKAVRGLVGLDGNDRYSRVQSELHEITRDFQRFKEQICSGISLDFTLSAITGLFQSFLAQLNKWLRWLQRKVDAVYRFLRHYLDTLKRLGVFDLLDQLKAMFDCILDETEICTSVETASSYYNAAVAKLRVYCTRANDWIIKPDYEEMCTGFMNGKIDELKDLCNKMENGLRLFVNPSNIHPTSDCLNLAGHITGIGKFLMTGKASNIPVYKYCKTKMSAIITAWNGTNPSEQYSSIDTLLEDLRFERDGIYVKNTRLAIEPSGTEEISLLLDDTQDTSSMSYPIVIGDDVYSASYSLYEFRNGSTDVVSYFNEYDVAYTDLVNLADCARIYS
jgi:hypothetical protein